MLMILTLEILYNTRTRISTATLFKQEYRYHKLRKAFFFSKFYQRHYDLVSKFNMGLKSILKQGLSDRNNCFVIKCIN